MDSMAYLVKAGAWIKGLYNRGFEGAHKAAAGLSY
jgi:hypothetical protein